MCIGSVGIYKVHVTWAKLHTCIQHLEEKLSLSLSPPLLTPYPGYIFIQCTEQLVTGTLQVEGFLHVDKKKRCKSPICTQHNVMCTLLCPYPCICQEAPSFWGNEASIHV